MKRSCNFIFLFILFLAPTLAFATPDNHRQVAVAFCFQQHPEWQACETDADCTLVPNACGNLSDSSSIRDQKYVAQCNAARAGSIDCNNRHLNPEGVFRVGCRNSYCTVLPQQ